MRIIKCIHPTDASFGEITYGVSYLSLYEWTYQMPTDDYDFKHYGIVLNQGIFFEFLDGRFNEVESL